MARSVLCFIRVVCLNTIQTLKQTQREKGRVMMTRSKEMLVRTHPHNPMPVFKLGVGVV